MTVVAGSFLGTLDVMVDMVGIECKASDAKRDKLAALTHWSLGDLDTI